MIDPLPARLHALAGRLSRGGNSVVAQADIAEAVARIVALERAMRTLLDHVDHVAYLDTSDSRLSDATPAVAIARAVLGKNDGADRGSLGPAAATI